MKVLLVGATGTIGQRVRERLGNDHEVIAAAYRGGDHQVDIADKASIEKLFAEVGDVDAVISTAGSAAFAPLAEQSDEQFSLAWDNKLMGQINLLRVGRSHIREGGAVLLTSGMLASEPMPGSASVSAANGALNAFVKAAALELGDSIRINAISPIFVKETMEMMGMDSASGMSASDTAKAYQAALEGTATGQVIDVRDAA